MDSHVRKSATSSTSSSAGSLLVGYEKNTPTERQSFSEETGKGAHVPEREEVDIQHVEREEEEDGNGDSGSGSFGRPPPLPEDESADAGDADMQQYLMKDSEDEYDEGDGKADSGEEPQNAIDLDGPNEDKTDTEGQSSAEDEQDQKLADKRADEVKSAASEDVSALENADGEEETVESVDTARQPPPVDGGDDDSEPKELLMPPPLAHFDSWKTNNFKYKFLTLLEANDDSGAVSFRVRVVCETCCTWLMTRVICLLLK
jgi:hypothetical protein